MSNEKDTGYIDGLSKLIDDNQQLREQRKREYEESLTNQDKYYDGGSETENPLLYDRDNEQPPDIEYEDDLKDIEILSSAPFPKKCEYDKLASLEEKLQKIETCPEVLRDNEVIREVWFKNGKNHTINILGTTLYIVLLDDNRIHIKYFGSAENIPNDETKSLILKELDCIPPYEYILQNQYADNSFVFDYHELELLKPEEFPLLPDLPEHIRKKHPEIEKHLKDHKGKT